MLKLCSYVRFKVPQQVRCVNWQEVSSEAEAYCYRIEHSAIVACEKYLKLVGVYLLYLLYGGIVSFSLGANEAFSTFLGQRNSFQKLRWRTFIFVKSMCVLFA